MTVFMDGRRSTEKFSRVFIAACRPSAAPWEVRALLTVNSAFILARTPPGHAVSTSALMPRMLGIAALASPPVLAGYGVASCVAVAAMMYKAMHEQPDAHMAATWITHTNACLAVCDRLTQVVFNFMCFVFVLNGRILQRVLLGPLRIQEFEVRQLFNTVAPRCATHGSV